RTSTVPGPRLHRSGRRCGRRGDRLGRRSPSGGDRGLPPRDRADASLQRGVSFVLALDQGTTGSAAIVFDEEANPRGAADREIAQHYPASGHVEHDPDELFGSIVAVGREALANAKVAPRDIRAIGITNQRETTIVWERASGRPIHPAVDWQSGASAGIGERLRAEGLETLVRERTGLVIDAYFSATKVRWVLDRVPGAQARAERGELVWGTVDSWLIWNLTNGRVHATDVSNASRTLVFDIHRGKWSDELLAALHIPDKMLARAVASSGTVGEADADHFGATIPIAGIAGDQQAALFGQTCFAQGEAKNTYGTGCFLLANARGLLIGIERGTTRAHIVRATLESIAYQTRDLVEAMERAGQRIAILRADGGGTANAFLMQFQSDILGIPVEVPAIRETTALGAAFLAGVGVGLWPSTGALELTRRVAVRYEPKMSRDQRDSLHRGWLRALERARDWAPR